ncbi:MAG: DEAD/DEAH box helicase [Kiritimatiellae bacterium]|jgi:ATP-dependent RNA helicase RhlB|nr:DEAD/DEAH box helicase [Kiritimatiellia bacterium]
MKIIKKLVSKLLGSKSSGKKTIAKKKPAKSSPAKSSPAKRSPAKSRNAKSSNNSNSNSNSRRRNSPASGDVSSSDNPRKGRNAGGNQKRSQEGGQSQSRRRKPEEGSSSGQPQRRRNNDKRRSSSSEHPRDRVNARTSGVARPKSRDGRPPRGHNSGGVRPGGAITAEERDKLLAAHAEWSLDSYKVEPAEDKKRFHDFDLPSEIMHAVADMGFEYCTPIQALSLEHALAGKNVAGKAQTGTGKTAAFLVAILTRYLRSPEKKNEKSGVPRALVIAPTRELVIQICKDAAAIGKYCGLRTLAVYGGMDYDRQKREVLAEPIDLLVATPGRLLDYTRQRVIDLSHVDTLVIDEADRMLDMGFIPDVRVIMNRLPRKDKRGTMLYSATLSEDVMRLASQWMDAPVHIEIESESMTTDTVDQVVYVITASEKFTVLYNLLQQYPDTRILVFCNRKVTTEKIVRKLQRLNVSCDMLSGDVNQNRRLRVLEDFREGKVRVVIATDVAGRGIHVDDIGFVVNYDFPYEAGDYVHRIGRTGRAGHQGTAISFADEDESFIIPDIEAFIKQPLKCTMLMGDDPLMADIPRPGRGRPRSPAKKQAHAPAEETKKESAPVQDSKNVAEDKTECKEETPAADRTPRGRGAPRTANTASGRRAPAPERSGNSSARKSSRPAAAPKAVSKGSRFSEEWVPGQ